MSYEDLVSEITSKVIREYDRMVMETLASFRIDISNSDEIRRRVSIVEDGLNKKHFYIDGLYAFTITQFNKTEDDWGINGRYILGISNKIEFIDSLIGHRLKEE